VKTRSKPVIKTRLLTDGSEVADILLTGRIGCGHGAYHSVQVKIACGCIQGAELLKEAIDAYAVDISIENL